MEVALIKFLLAESDPLQIGSLAGDVMFRHGCKHGFSLSRVRVGKTSVDKETPVHEFETDPGEES